MVGTGQAHVGSAPLCVAELVVSGNDVNEIRKWLW
jgi:hypothetical protein